MPDDAGRGRRPLGPLTALVLALGALGLLLGLVLPLLGLPVAAWLQSLQGWVQGLGSWGPVVFALLFALATLLMLPGAPLGMLAGAAFGLATGTACTWAGAVLGATAALLLARGLLRPRVERLLAGHPRLAALDLLLARRGAWVACLLRLTPALPFNLLNYALGLTRLSLPASLLACVAMLPGTLLYVGAGAAAGAALEGRPDGSLRLALLLTGLAATALLTVWLARVARAALPPPPRGTAPEDAAR